jgi:hypothetical protein
MNKKIVLSQKCHLSNKRVWYFIIVVLYFSIHNKVFYVPEAYLKHFSYRCLFLNCSVQRPGWVGGRDIVNSLRPAREGGGVVEPDESTGILIVK